MNRPKAAKIDDPSQAINAVVNQSDPSICAEVNAPTT